MGILGALSTAVSGLSAQSYALENISGNIANSSTVGFKRVDSSFVDLIPDRPANQEIAGTVAAYSQLTNTIQGTLSPTGVKTNMALNGDGYFVVAVNTGSTTAPTFGGESLYTRRGDFAPDANGYLVNGSGKFLTGTTFNPATGAVTGSITNPVKISNATLPASVTKKIDISGNLPSVPTTATSTGGGSNLLKPADAANSKDSAGASPPANGTLQDVDGADVDTFLNETISGGSVTAYSSSGAPATVQLRWGKTANASGSGDDTWSLYYQKSQTATAGQVSWTRVGDATFDSASQLKTPSPATLAITGLAVNGVSVGDVSVDLSGGLTQYSDTNGTASTAIVQNGYYSGNLNSISVTSDGRISGSYSNGQIATLAQVTVAHFSANDALKRMDGSTYAQTTESGTPTYGLEGSSISGGSVEQSNTDISDEFSKMIVTQQAYSANTRVMSTAQQMLQDVINIIR